MQTGKKRKRGKWKREKKIPENNKQPSGGPIRFWVAERPVRSRMPRPIYLYHPVRMTDGGFDKLVPSGTDGMGGPTPRFESVMGECVM